MAIVGTSGNDTLDGTIFGEVIKGLGGDDTLNGKAGADVLIGGTGADIVSGGLGGDVLEVGDGDTADGDIYDGGSGSDRLAIADTIAPVAGEFSVDFLNSTIASIETLDFDGSVDISARFAASSFGGTGFADGLLVDGSSSADRITIITGTDLFLDLRGLTFVNWGTGNTISIFGDDSNEIIFGSSQDDVIFGGSGTDSVIGGGGDDTVIADRTTIGDTYDGGAGSDTLSVSAVLVDVKNALLTSFEQLLFDRNNASASHSISFFANQFGGAGVSSALQIAGSFASTDAVDISMGGSANFDASGFVISGFSGLDRIEFFGDNDSESIIGSSAADSMFGNGGSDVLGGGVGNDFLDGGAGADSMLGGAGDDTYVIDDAGDFAAEILIGADPGGVDTVLASVTHTLTGFIENLVLNGAAAIDGIGNGLANTITGNGGANILKGLGGADRLIGGGGADGLNGGGNDRFIYTAITDSGVGAGVRDFIQGFATGDRINVAAIDANTTLALNQAFILDAGGGFVAGEFRFVVGAANTIIEFNTDADAAAEMQIVVRNVTSLTAAGLIL